MKRQRIETNNMHKQAHQAPCIHSGTTSLCCIDGCPQQLMPNLG